MAPWFSPCRPLKLSCVVCEESFDSCFSIIPISAITSASRFCPLPPRSHLQGSQCGCAAAQHWAKVLVYSYWCKGVGASGEQCIGSIPLISARRRKIVERKLSLHCRRIAAAPGLLVAATSPRALPLAARGGLALYYRGANSPSGAAGAAIRTRPSVAAPARYPERQPMGAGRCLRPGGAAPRTAAGLGWRDKRPRKLCGSPARAAHAPTAPAGKLSRHPSGATRETGKRLAVQVFFRLVRIFPFLVMIVVSFMRLVLRTVRSCCCCFGATSCRVAASALASPGCLPACLLACSPSADSEGYLCAWQPDPLPPLHPSTWILTVRRPAIEMLLLLSVGTATSTAGAVCAAVRLFLLVPSEGEASVSECGTRPSKKAVLRHLREWRRLHVPRHCIPKHSTYAVLGD